MRHVASVVRERTRHVVRDSDVRLGGRVAFGRWSESAFPFSLTRETHAVAYIYIYIYYISLALAVRINYRRLWLPS